MEVGRQVNRYRYWVMGGEIGFVGFWRALEVGRGTLRADIG